MTDKNRNIYKLNEHTRAVRRLSHKERGQWLMFKDFMAAMHLGFCSNCCEILAYSDFSRDKTHKCGITSQCKLCNGVKKAGRPSTYKSKRNRDRQLEGEAWRLQRAKDRHFISFAPTHEYYHITRPMGKSEALQRTGKVLDWLVQGDLQGRYDEGDPNGEGVHP